MLLVWCVTSFGLSSLGLSCTMANGKSTEEPTKQSGGRSCLTAIALFLVYLLLSGILLVLPTGFIGPVFALGGFLLVGVIGFHYFLWGRWLSRVLKEETSAEDISQKSQTDRE